MHLSTFGLIISINYVFHPLKTIVIQADFSTKNAGKKQKKRELVAPNFVVVLTCSIVV